MAKSIYTREYRILTDLLRETRMKAGITQVELASRLRQTQSYVSKIERGERRLDLVQLRGLCDALGASLPELVATFDGRVRTKGRR